MIRETRFLISRRPYAVDLSSLRVVDEYHRQDGTPYYWLAVRAAWFRRRQGVTVACVGELRDTQDGMPADAVAFLTAYDDGRYGGDCYGRWDGAGYWGAEVPATRDAHMALLVPMLAAYPQVPPGFDGWWRF